MHPLGGTAYLALEADDEPYLGGVKYTAMPPTKRFRDMEQLSGGAGHAYEWLTVSSARVLLAVAVAWTYYSPRLCAEGQQ